MPLLNWPPSKGPKPPHLEVVWYFTAPKVSRKDLNFKKPASHREEQKRLLDAAWQERDRTSKHHYAVISPATRDGSSDFVDDEIVLWQHVRTVSTLTLEQAHTIIAGVGKPSRKIANYLPISTVTLELTYPLLVGRRLKIPPFIIYGEIGDGSAVKFKEQSIGYILWVASREYVRIYKNWRTYGIWGHSIDDLYFTRFKATSKGKAELSVCSSV